MHTQRNITVCLRTVYTSMVTLTAWYCFTQTEQLYGNLMSMTTINIFTC
jgi:hypothetical protein